MEKPIEKKPIPIKTAQKQRFHPIAFGCEFFQLSCFELYFSKAFSEKSGNKLQLAL